MLKLNILCSAHFVFVGNQNWRTFFKFFNNIYQSSSVHRARHLLTNCTSVGNTSYVHQHQTSFSIFLQKCDQLRKGSSVAFENLSIKYTKTLLSDLYYKT